MAKVPNAVEILPKIWTAWVGRMNVTDDRKQTDGRAIAYSEREREFTFANNDWEHASMQMDNILNIYCQRVWLTKVMDK